LLSYQKDPPGFEHDATTAIAAKQERISHNPEPEPLNINPKSGNK